MRSRSFSHFPRYLVKRRCFVLPSSRCVSKINRYPTSKFVIRPAKLRLPSMMKSSLIRPSKLNLQNTKLFLLKPPTLLLPDDAKSKKKKCRFSAPPQLASASSVPLTSGKVFDSKSLSHANFKSLVSTDCEIIKAFDTLSFKQLRSPAQSSSLPLESGDSSTTTNKRESTSNSCSVQARMESTAPPDCDDTSIDELASYFDLFVHIPKKMSSMAEMMYI